MVCMSLDCVGLTQASVIQIIYRNVGLKCFFHLPKLLLLWLVFACIYILQGSVETHLLCSGIYNNHIIANCLQSVPVKQFWKSVNIGDDMDRNKVPHFLWPTVYYVPQQLVMLQDVPRPFEFALPYCAQYASVFLDFLQHFTIHHSINPAGFFVLFHSHISDADNLSVSVYVTVHVLVS